MTKFEKISPRTRPQNWPAPSFRYSTCATFRSHISNSWALVSYSVSRPRDGLYVRRCMSAAQLDSEAWWRQCGRTSRRLIMLDVWHIRRRNSNVHTCVDTRRDMRTRQPYIRSVSETNSRQTSLVRYFPSHRRRIPIGIRKFSLYGCFSRTFPLLRLLYMKTRKWHCRCIARFRRLVDIYQYFLHIFTAHAQNVLFVRFREKLWHRR